MSDRAAYKKFRQVVIGGISSDAIDRVAARVTSPGESVIVKLRPEPHRRESEDMISIRKIRPGDVDKNLTDKRCGLFTVVGMSSELNGRWVVRCDCGKYEIRTAKSIKNERNRDDCCRECRKYKYITKSARHFCKIASGLYHEDRKPDHALGIAEACSRIETCGGV